MHNFTNNQLAKLLREIAASYTIKKVGNIFQIRAYESAADAIEHSTSEIKDLWEEGKLDTVPGLGESMRKAFNSCKGVSVLFSGLLMLIIDVPPKPITQRTASLVKLSLQRFR